MSGRRPAAVALVGMTASGKSALAHDVAVELGDVEIVSLDSMCVYREMDLATAKPTPTERTEVDYHLIDLVDPAEEFDLSSFQRAAREAVAGVVDRGRRVLYVGGTGLYARAVIDDLEIPGQYPEVRAELEARATSDLGALVAELTHLDPLAASRMEPTNARRVVRALEVTIGSGRAFSSYGPGLEAYPSTNVVQVARRVPREDIDERIARRFREWMDLGLLDEVRALAARPAGLSRTARQAVGYRELLGHVEDGRDLDQSVADAITATRRLARRQLSWFTRDPRVEWFDDDGDARRRLVELLRSHETSVGD